MPAFAVLTVAHEALGTFGRAADDHPPVTLICRNAARVAGIPGRGSQSEQLPDPFVGEELQSRILQRWQAGPTSED